ncbi:hypothetical protein HPB50_018045 [Hyalomma asiaticum]|uniref:Uncharacterized protein n=1 Tax=Hyalomma asiaticum TaxID=266040 RepID=A0ACB7S810_HYAAI|nr:hypothetical protein HPB50_018045 [Hyalomma asiaticum]
MPNEEAASSSGPRTAVALFVLLAPPLISGLAALMWIMMHNTASSGDELPEVPPFCCPDAIETILALSNLSNDPCSDFLSYACYRKSGVDRTAIAVRAFTSAVVHPTLQGKLHSPVSEIIWRNHKSCLYAAVKSLFIPEYAVTAVIDLFRRWSGTSASSPAAPVDFVKLVGLLHFRYDVDSVLTTYYKSSFESREAVFVISYHPAPDIVFDVSSYEDAMFEAARRHAGINASRVDVYRLAGRFRSSREDADNRYTVPISLLDEQFPKEAISSWKEILSTVPAIAVENPPDVAAVLRILMDNSTLFQETALLYFSILTTLATFPEELRWSPSLTDNAALCEDLTMELFPLWDVLATQQMTSPYRDQVVMRVFHRASETVIADAQHLFSAHLDSEEVQRVVRSMRVVLAGNLTAPYELYLPSINENYFENKFEMRSFYYQLTNSNALRGLSGLYSLRFDFSRTFITRFDDQIAVSASVYALLSFGNDTGRGGRNADVINAAVLGVMLADALWDRIFEHVEGNSDTWQGLVEHERCLQQQAEEGALKSELRYPVLSLVSAIRMVVMPGWHQRAPVFDFHSLSASQVFFILFFVHHSCLWAESDSSGMRASLLMRHLDEFRKAFGCGRLPKANATALCEKHERE